jgi:tetratricopeptide (TPR) repeat protein
MLLVGGTALCLLAATQPAWSKGYTNSDFLPEYCKHTKDGEIKDPGQIRQYEQIFGPAFSHMHHYCRGLLALHEAAQITDNPMLRDGKFRGATGEFNYVLSRSDDSFVLRPEILVKKGMAALAVDDDIEAIKSFREAILLRPDYVPAYVALSNYLLKMGDRIEARRVLEAALEHAPNNAYLRDKLSELDDVKQPGISQNSLD